MSASRPRGNIDGPPSGAAARSLVLVWGWAIDQGSASGPGIRDVRVYLDGVLSGTATYGIARHDVEDHFGPAFLKCGWRFALDLSGVATGPHTLSINIRGAESGIETTYAQVLTVEASPPPLAPQKLALFVSGCPGSPMRYRSEHQAEQIRLLGGTADFAAHGEIDLGEAVEHYQLVILHRVLFTEEVQWFLRQARRRGTPVLYDVDDLIFDVTAAPFIAHFEQMARREREQFLDCVALMGAGLRACDAVLVSSEPLRQSAAAYAGHARVRVVPNVVNASMQHLADTVVQRSSAPACRSDEQLSIGYLSGTATHDSDFLQAAEALVWALDTYPVTRLVTVGPVALDARFVRFGERIQRMPLYDWQLLPEVLASIDISIAPLEPDNPFTEAKSCIKYFEAALVGVPTIASPRADFRRTVTHGVTGYLADSPAEWRAALQCLIGSAEHRQEIGRRARADVLLHHTTKSAASPFRATLADLVSPSNIDNMWSSRQSQGEPGRRLI